mmetsp:Transcript_2304/g.8828  ORF Transcript_2304/g.8828 Transcript_2304/m.8828 type:complete len:81 (-) Transcript_2304:1383-1625(-)
MSRWRTHTLQQQPQQAAATQVAQQVAAPQQDVLTVKGTVGAPQQPEESKRAEAAAEETQPVAPTVTLAEPSAQPVSDVAA